jgi:LemA protein
MNNLGSSFSIAKYLKWIIIGVVILGLFTWVVSSYNSIVTLNENTEEQWSQVRTAYQRRFDLIPNLVETVKGSADFEKSTLENVINARSKVGSMNITSDMLNDPEKMKAFEQAQSGFQGALSRLMVVVEKYPDLKTTQQFADLMVQLEGTENRINQERRKFNEVVKDYNKRIRTFPGNLFAGMFGFEKKSYFEGDTANEQAPAVGNIFKDK